ncbi:MAG: hypothetical protein ACKVY0_14310 [Prosthecobacter sp.]|uniref:hypothetical protein n=1 Tax=Prosthecobacter sp. TaxID=1965333 RepID=UPI0039002BE9
MIWRVAAILAVLFWAVMSGLLVRDVYFPEASRFAIVPPRVVLELFLRHSESFGSTLHLYHHREKIGHASFQISRRIKPNHQTVYDVLARGVLEEPVPGKEARRIGATWNVACILADAERWQHVTLSADFPNRDASLKISWDDKQTTPEVLVKQGGRVVMNSQDVQKVMGFGSEGALSMLSMLGGMPKGQAAPVLQAREGVMTLAGRERKCFVLTLPILGTHEVKMIFTEAGELARIDLPEGYALLEPMIYGLQDGNH